MTALPVRPYGRLEVPAPTGTESAAFDRWAIEERAVPQPTLMENAGRAVAGVVQRLFPRGDVVAVVGAGNNGGDALVALRTLLAWGRSVRAVIVADRELDDPVLHGWPVARVEDGEAWSGRDPLDGAGVVVDGVLGTGIRGEPRERQGRAIDRINRAGRPVLSVDVPSGVDADTGAVAGAAVNADVTVTFGAPKLGTLFHPARALVGRLVAVEIGFPPPTGDHVAAARILTPSWAAAHRPARAPVTHKKAVGTLLVIAGSRGMAGAAVLAARAALRIGVGLVRICTVEANRTVVQTAVPEAVFVDVTDAHALAEALDDSAAVVAGPGLGTGPGAVAALEGVLGGSGRPLLLDADALNLLGEGRPAPLEEVVAGRPCVLTPHPGEMVRISGTGKDDIAADAPGVARRFAEELGCTLLLKGMPSVVASPGERVLVDSVGSSDLATAGMGDVLSGTVGGFLARGVRSVVAAGLGLHVSGRAAVRAGRGGGLLPTDVIRHLPDALLEDGPGHSELELPGLLFDQDPAR